MVPSVLHLSTYDGGGGAGRAAYALHRAMVDSGLDSSMRVARTSNADETVRAGSDLRFRVANALEHRLWSLQTSPIVTWRSPAVFGSCGAREINGGTADVVNIHWATDGLLSIREIGRIAKPIVWSVYDMWPFSGSEHYGTDIPQARWRTGYTRRNRPKDEHGLDLDRLTWERKSKWWARARHVVAASSWMRRAIEQSALMHDWPTHLIPHVIDCDAFSPMDMREARLSLGLPQAVPLVLFLASAGINDHRKGWDLLDEALMKVRVSVPDVEVVIVGPTADGYSPVSGVPIHWRGTVQGNEALRLHYSAANVTAVPSREDNMPLTAMEAQSCGRPVVAFNLGGLPDIVDHEQSGYLAEPLDPQSLAEGLNHVLADEHRAGRWADHARTRALATWSRPVVTSAYQQVFQAAISAS